MLEVYFKKTLFSRSYYISLSLSLILFLSLSMFLGSCKTRESYSSPIVISNIDTFNTTNSDQKWQFYKEFFHKGTSWDKVIKLNDKIVNIRYEILDFNIDSDSYTIQVSSNGKTKTYIQNKESFLSDLSSINNICSKETTFLKEATYFNYDAIEITTSDLSEEELIATLPDLEGLAQNIQSSNLSIFILPKEGFTLKTQILINTKDGNTVDFTVSVENLQL